MFFFSFPVDYLDVMFSIHQSAPERYVKDAFQWMVPFLHRCEGHEEGAAEALLRQYLVSLAERDLNLPLLIFQQSKPDVRHTHKLENAHKTNTHTRTHLISVAVVAVSGPLLPPGVAGVVFMILYGRR